MWVMNGMGRTMFEFQYLIFQSQKYGFRVQLSKRWTRWRSFNVKKNHVRVCPMNDLLKAFWVRCWMSVCSKPKFMSSSSIINRWTIEHVRVRSMFKMMLEFVRCSINGVWPITRIHWDGSITSGLLVKICFRE